MPKSVFEKQEQKVELPVTEMTTEQIKTVLGDFERTFELLGERKAMFKFGCLRPGAKKPGGGQYGDTALYPRILEWDRRKKMMRELQRRREYAQRQEQEAKEAQVAMY